MKKPPEQKKVAEWLKDTREALQMTQREFAAHLAKTAPFANANFVAKMELAAAADGRVRAPERHGDEAHQIFSDARALLEAFQ